MTTFFNGSARRVIASGLIGLALVSDAASSVLAHRGAATTTQDVRVVHGVVARGAVRSGVVNLAALPPASPAQIKAATARGAATLHAPRSTAQQAAYRQWAQTHPGALPQVTAMPAPRAPNTYGNGALPVLVSKHEGLNSADAGIGPGYPNQALAVAPGYVFEGANNLMAVYTWSYTVKYGPWTPDQFFASIKRSGGAFSDPQITYDAERHAYLIAWLELETDGNDLLDIAISKTATPSPLGNFYVYQVDPQVIAANDYCYAPTLGYDYWGMYIACTTFDSQGAFNAWTNNTFAFNINQMLSGSLGAFNYWGSIISSVCDPNCEPAFSPSPTLEDGVPQAEWVTATSIGYGVSTDTLSVCAITSTHAIGSSTIPTFTCANNLLPLQYNDPFYASEPGAPNRLYPGYGYKQVAYRNGQLYFAMTMAINCSGNTHDGIYWAAVDPQLTTLAAHNPQQVNALFIGYTQAGEFCYSDADVFLPTLIADTEGDMTLVANYSSSTVNPEIIYTGRAAADGPSMMGQGVYSTAVVIASNATGSLKWSGNSACALTTNLVTRGIVFCGGQWDGPNTSPTTSGWDTELYEIRME